MLRKLFKKERTVKEVKATMWTYDHYNVFDTMEECIEWHSFFPEFTSGKVTPENVEEVTVTRFI